MLTVVVEIRRGQRKGSSGPYDPQSPDRSPGYHYLVRWSLGRCRIAPIIYSAEGHSRPGNSNNPGRATTHESLTVNRYPWVRRVLLTTPIGCRERCCSIRAPLDIKQAVRAGCHQWTT